MKRRKQISSGRQTEGCYTAELVRAKEVSPQALVNLLMELSVKSSLMARRCQADIITRFTSVFE